MTTDRILHHINLMVDDLDTAVAFYRDLIGMELDETPDHDFPSQFFKFTNGPQIHMNEFPDAKGLRSHFCIVVNDFNDIFRRMKKAGAIDVEVWGKIRRLDSGAIQMFTRDPSGNLVEITSQPDVVLDEDILGDELLDTAVENNLYYSGRDEHRRGK